MAERILIVAPSWVGDAILSEPLVALLREPYEDPIVDVLVNAWCAPVYARMRGIRRIIENPIGHGKLDLAGRRRLARTLKGEGYTHAFVLPNSWKSALVPWLAGIPKRVGYRGEARFALLTDARPLDRKAKPRLVERFAALAVARGALVPMPPSPVLVPDTGNRAAAMRALHLKTDRPVVILCPGAEFGAAKRWPPNQFAELASMFLDDGLQVWIVGSPNDRIAADAVLNSLGENMHRVRDLTARTDLGTAIDVLSSASLVVSNDSGLMHAAAAVGVPLVALFGSSSPAYTPPLSPLAQIAKIDIACSPCFKRECPLGHFKCMRELKPAIVYNLARAALPAWIPPDLRRY
ncbi:MAG: lipopolysaccharide heptosyltransferase II [Betaproteobacteria bacterium]|nr:lipopolysaccharide heptosyltransferase II [Betaproteobacteria bacterium]MCC7215690.1 lipopolysaccharide heptosyltransferase II [Burkholderiales bacterium]